MKNSFKSKIRERLKNERTHVSPADALYAGQRLLSHLVQMRSQIPSPCEWLLYFPLQGEISTLPLFDWIKTKKQEPVFFPRVEKGSSAMNFHFIEDLLELRQDNFLFQPPADCPTWNSKSSLSIDAPRSTIAIIPGLAFHGRSGARIGFGRGFYDRFLAQHPQVHRWALSFEFQVLDESWEPDPTDIPMDWIFTPSAIWGSSSRRF